MAVGTPAPLVQANTGAAVSTGGRPGAGGFCPPAASAGRCGPGLYQKSTIPVPHRPTSLPENKIHPAPQSEATDILGYRRGVCCGCGKHRSYSEHIQCNSKLYFGQGMPGAVL
ncbi:hypothetical protein DWUX_2006 [Desulfovibrio diazotrophicus]|nr:hypothetical protein DWUX_2006 [Desulfovibrio diazotrophicus]